ncbi:GntR family transcriptional regulator [Nitriliruptor alkaliphilus]|uniref:GntR family transcriptional regulator n=1 Tax=Nitriliruptor alkaliphilus TaxID=427918 RepID=UPI000695F66F|nr:GntR family transcriptional regulator [Nitriliruptor alkaliphilus]
MPTPSRTDEQVRETRSTQARRLRDALRLEVLECLDSGAVLPSEADLADRYEATRNAVREALGLMRSEGLVDRRPRTGTTVVGQKATAGTDRLLALSEYVKSGDGAITNEVLAARVVRANPTVARKLERAPGEAVVLIERRRMVEGRPLSLDTTFVPHDLGARLLDTDLAGTDLFHLMERDLGVDLVAASTSIEALPADPDAAALLAIPVGTPLLASSRLVLRADAVPAAMEFVRYRHDRIVLSGQTFRGKE